MNAKQANKLTNAQLKKLNKPVNTLAGVTRIIKTAINNGTGNAFVNLSEKNEEKIVAKLKQLGYTVWTDPYNGETEIYW